MNPFTIELANERRQSLLDEADNARRATRDRRPPRWVRRWRNASGIPGGTG